MTALLTEHTGFELGKQNKHIKNNSKTIFYEAASFLFLSHN